MFIQLFIQSTRMEYIEIRKMYRERENLMDTIRNTMEFVFKKGEHKGEKYFVNMSLLCQNPLCRCTEIFFRISYEENFTDSSHRYSFYLDITKRKLLSHSKTVDDQLSKNFAKSFMSNSTDEDWEYFSSYFRSVKAEIANKIGNINDLKYDFSPLEYEIESKGTMSAYRDIIPYADEFVFDFNNRKYLILDLYCLKSACKCKDVFFVICEVIDNKAEEIKGHSDVLYNYSKGTWEKEPSIDGILKEMKKVYPSINSIVEKRHKTLRTMYKNYRVLNEIPEVQSISQRKIGRNDPCICGSGKKYKKCCG